MEKLMTQGKGNSSVRYTYRHIMRYPYMMINCLLCVEISHEQMCNLGIIVHDDVIRTISLILLSFLIVLHVLASVLE